MEQYTGKKVATFQQRFATLCEETPNSLTALADSLHVSKQTVSAWKNGTRSPKRPTIISIAEHFGVTIEWLMGFDVEKMEDKIAKQIVIPDSELFVKIINAMSQIYPYDYAMVMQAFEKTEIEMKKRGSYDR